MRLPMKPSQTPETTPIFLICFAIPRLVASTSLPVFAPRTISRSLVTLAGLKKCSPTTSPGRRVIAAILSRSSVEVLEASMAPGFILASSVSNTRCFTCMSSNTASITRVGLRDVVVGKRALDETEPLVEVLLSQPALLERPLVVLADHAEPLVERRLAGLEHRDRYAGIGEIHGDAAAHGAGADDRHRFDRPRRRSGRNIRESWRPRGWRRTRAAAPSIRCCSAIR